MCVQTNFEKIAFISFAAAGARAREKLSVLWRKLLSELIVLTKFTALTFDSGDYTVISHFETK